MTKFLVTCILFLISNAANCQDSYVTNNGDTIHGKITNYTQWSKSPVKVDFIDNAGNNTILTPMNCKSFMVDNSDVYISYSGNRIVNTDNIKSSVSTGNEVMNTEHIDGFLRRIYQYKGFTLYKYSDSKRINFFLDSNGWLKELEYYEYIDDRSNSLQTDNAYKFYISTQLKDISAPNKQKEINNLVYREDALINFFAKILGDKANATERKRNKYTSEIFGGIGLDGKFGSAKHTDGSRFHQTGFSPLFEIGMRIYGQRNFGKLFFQPLIGFSFLNNNTVTQAFTLKSRGTLLSLRLGPGYTFLKKQNISVYASAMVQLDFIFGYKSTYTYTYNSGTFNGTYNSSETMIKFTLNPEVGLIINHSINIALQGSLPYKLSGYYSTNFYYVPYFYSSYSMYSLGVVVRYNF